MSSMNDLGQDRNPNKDDEEATSSSFDDKRHEIRKTQRSLRKEIPNLGIDEAIKRNNAIFEENLRFGFIREAVLDADNLHGIAKHASIKMGNPMEGLRYDTDSVVRNLVDKFRVTKEEKSYFDWKCFGQEAAICFNAVPGRINFLNGALVDGNEKAKQRVKRTLNISMESDVEEERPIDVQGHTDRGANRLSAIDDNIQNIHQTLIAKVKRTYKSKKKAIGEAYGGTDAIPKHVRRVLKRNKDVCAIELLFNPKSFTQTVENICNYSFLVKEGKASLKVRNEKFVGDDETVHRLDGGPVASYMSNNDHHKKSPPKPRQAIVSLTMEDWKSLVEAYDVKESDVKHRDP